MRFDPPADGVLYTQKYNNNTQPLEIKRFIIIRAIYQ